MCFDQVFIPTGSIGHIFRLLGEFRSDALAAEGVLQFIHWEGYDSIWLESAAAGFGHLATGRRGNGDPGEMISRQLSPVPGKEAEAAALLARIERSTVCVDLSGEKNFADVCSGLFVSPKTRMLLGISEGTPAGQIPRWAAHPALRVVQIAPIGATCQKLGFSSMKIMPGAAEAAELAFSALSRGTLASDPGSYALSGQFGVIHETALAANPGIWDAIIRFRTGGPGLNFRAEILKQLALNNGAEIVPAINGRLHDMLPPAILNLAR